VIDETTARSILQQVYATEAGIEAGIEAAISRLPGELDANFLVETATHLSPDGRPKASRSILKVMHEGCSEERVALQCGALEHLGMNPNDVDHPTVMATRSGAPYEWIDVAGTRRIAWRLTFCAGILYADWAPQTAPLHRSLGELLGRLTLALEEFTHPAMDAPHPWQLTAAASARPYVEAVAPSHRRHVERAFERFDHRVAEPLAALRQSVVHNDANDYNLLVRGGRVGDPGQPADEARVTGIFDFGDLCRQPTVCELAIGIAYAILGQESPLAAAREVVAGFHEIYPLEEREVDLLFDLVSTRLAVSLAISSHRQIENPDDPYIAVSQRPAMEALARLAELCPEAATAQLRTACGFPPVSTAAEVVEYLASPETPVHPAIAIEGPEIVLDLGSGSQLLGADPRQTQLGPLTEVIDREMKRARVAFSIGRYGESRALYSAPAFTGDRHPTAEHRTHHLGLDVFCPAGTSVFAPLDGVVELAVNNDGPLDYGGLIVLRHKTPGGAPFYTLYGHLSAESVLRSKSGDAVAAGEEIARLGEPYENGGWPPHLHIQWILDLFGLGVDFPGVALESESDFWQAVSPNPERLLGYSDRADFEGRVDLDSIQQRRRDRLGYNLSLSYSAPLHAVRGYRQFLYDSRGQAYLDIYNNVPHVGHSHPRVVAAVQRQIGLLNTNTRYLHETILTYAERLADKLPEPLNVCFFVNSGSEANELALRLARAHTGRKDVLVAEGAYHGHTTGLIDISPYKHDGPGGHGAPPWVHSVANPDDFRGRWKRGDPEAGAKFAGLVAEALAEAESAGRSIGAFISETYPSVGGQILPPPGYVAAAYEHTRAAGALAIADEIQTGFGRLGEAFWGFEAQGAVPDIVVLGKPIANGFPMGAVVTTAEIAAEFDNGMEFFSTFGGNPVATAAALAVLDVVEEEGLEERARELGASFIRSLRDLQSDVPLIGDVRGQGFFLGVELIRNRDTLQPADRETSYVADRLRDHRILAGTDGVHHNVLKIRPSMAIEKEDLDLVLERLRSIFRETALR